MGLVTLPAGATAVDFSFQPPDPAHVKDMGYSAVIGYLPWDPNAIERGCLHHAMIEAFYEQDLAWSCCWELNEDRALAGFNIGIADGNSAGASARGLGAAPGSVVHCVVDFEAHPASVVDYCAGFAEAVSGFGFTPGGYGSRAVVEHLVAGVHVRSGWQTEAWSYGLVSPYAHLLQRANYKPIAGTDHNDLLKPMPFTSGSSGGSPMFTPEEERKIVEVLSYPYEPFGRAALIAEVMAAVNANAARIEALAADVKELLSIARNPQPAGQVSGLDIARALVALLGGNTRLQTPSEATTMMSNRRFTAPPAPADTAEEGLAAAVAGIEMLARSSRRVQPPVADTPT